MEASKNNNSAKKIAEKYQFSEVAKLNKDEMFIKYKEMYYSFTELAIDFEILNNENVELKKENIELKKPKAEKPKYEGFNPEWTGIEKVIFILKENSKPMLSNQIENELLFIQPSLKDSWRVTRTASLKYITQGLKYGLIIKYKPHNHFLYGLPEWFADNGEIFNKFKA